ncbi:MAG: hypothetical protein CMI62_03855 [Parvibaculum sp.]|nr:hypothetical protein [Parvibaculum sp.]
MTLDTRRSVAAFVDTFIEATPGEELVCRKQARSFRRFRPDRLGFPLNLADTKGSPDFRQASAFSEILSDFNGLTDAAREVAGLRPGCLWFSVCADFRGRVSEMLQRSLFIGGRP